MNNIEFSHLKQNPFLTPPGYFDALPDMVAQKIGQKTIWSVTTTLRPLLRLAASIIVLLGLGYGTFSLITSKTADMDSLTAGAHISRFDTYMLLNSMDEFDKTYDSEQIITYLTEHGVSRFTIAALD